MNNDSIKKIRESIPVGILEAKKLLHEAGSVEKAVARWSELQEKELRAVESKEFEDLNELWYFDSEHCENISSEERSGIRVLTSEYSAKMWSEYISAEHRHLMLVKNNEWKLIKTERASYNWLDDWNEDDELAFARNIAPLLSWNENEQVLFFWGRYSSVKASWGLVCKYWMSFLYEDEMNVIINPNSENALLLGVNGYVELVKRA